MDSQTLAEKRASIRSELDATRAGFHALLDEITPENLARRSHNPGWTNGEVLFHITLGFILIPVLVPILRVFGRLPRRYSKTFAAVLNSGTRPFNAINGLGPRIGTKLLSGRRLGDQYDRSHRAILRIVDSLPDREWSRGMYYPTRWEPLFADYMLLEDVLRFPSLHFRFHQDQLSR